jgi:hypothetical protein
VPYHSLKRDKISTLGALTVSPQRKHLALYRQFHNRNIDGLDVIAFLSELLKHLRGEIILLGDRSPIPIKRQAVTAYLHQHPRIHMLKNSQLMLQSLIQPSTSGIKRIGRHPTQRQKTCSSSNPCSPILLLGLVTHKSFFGLVSMLLIYRGVEILYIHYLCEPQ